MSKAPEVNLRLMPSRLVVCAILALIGTAPAASAATSEKDPLVHALERVETTDWDNRWLGYGMALAGSAVSIGMGSWALSESAFSHERTADSLVLTASIGLVGMAASQVIHGGMRFNERVQSARTARAMLRQHKLREQNGLFFLRQRAQTSRSTRFWGATMTTLQGVATAALGARIMQGASTKGSASEAWRISDDWQTPGGIIFGLGIVNTVIGAIHYPGLTRAEKILKGVESSPAYRTDRGAPKSAGRALPKTMNRERAVQRLLVTDQRRPSRFGHPFQVRTGK